MAAVPEVMEAPAIDENAVGTYINITDELPLIGASVEVLYFILPRRYPLETYSIYKGTVVRCDGGSITLARGATCTYVTELETIGERPARQNIEDGIQLTTFGNYRIYWKALVTIPSIALEPKKVQRPKLPIELYYEPDIPTKYETPIKSPSTEYGTPPTTMVSPSSLSSLYGGKKRTKRRKTKRKSKRKK